MVQIDLKSYRLKVDNEYVGFAPNGGLVKPVHIANGAQRLIFGKFNSSDLIRKMSLIYNAKGQTPKGNSTKEVYELLTLQNKIDKDRIKEADLENLRVYMQKLLSADRGAFADNSGNMISFTTSSKYFLTKRTIYEDAGEFIGGIIKEYCEDLANHIAHILDLADDPITLLFKPILTNDDMQVSDAKNGHRFIKLDIETNEHWKNFIKSIIDSGSCLYENLKKNNNTLNKLRIFNLFCIFHLIRYMSLLEAFYCNGRQHPILIDCYTNISSNRIINSSSRSSFYKIMISIENFYAWAFSQELERQGISKLDLLSSQEAPIDDKAKSDKDKEKIENIWNMAKEKAKNENDDNARRIFGRTMYDLLAVHASAHPIRYITSLGTSIGILYPPSGSDKRFICNQDILEMLIYSLVKPNEVLEARELRKRLFKYFGIVCGRPTELDEINKDIEFLEIDQTLLDGNFTNFSSFLESMDFAEVMADGVLQVRI